MMGTKLIKKDFLKRSDEKIMPWYFSRGPQLTPFRLFILMGFKNVFTTAISKR